MSSIGKSEQELMQIASSAVTRYKREVISENGKGISLTDSVVASARPYMPMTHEHVKRICEFTYHDAFERIFNERRGIERNISFDPAVADDVSVLLGLRNTHNRLRG